MKERILLAKFGSNPITGTPFSFLYFDGGKSESGNTILRTSKGGNLIEADNRYEITEATDHDLSNYFWGN